MTKKRKNKEKKFSPIIVMLIITLVIAVMSLFGSIIGMQGEITSIATGNLETSLVTVKNVLSFDGLNYIFANLFSNYQLLTPLVLIIITFISLSIFEASGLASVYTEHLKKKSFKYITFMTLLIAIISSVIGDYAFIIIVPLTALIYKHIGRNPVIGIIVSFLGISIGYGAGLVFNYNDYALGLLTQNAAIIDVDKNFVYTLMSNFIIMAASALILSFIGSIIVEKILIPRIPKYRKSEVEVEEYKVSKKGMNAAALIATILLLIVFYQMLPSLPGAGMLLDNNAEVYLEKLFGPASPFNQSISIIIMIIVMIASYVYGKVSGNLKNSFDYNEGLTKSFDKIGYIFVLLFFYALMITVLNYTELATVIAVNIIDFMSKLQFSGLPLIATFFIIVVLLSLIIPDTLIKWNLMAPLTVPLLMRANITPNFTTFIFKCADGVGKSITPLFVFFIVMIALVDKYNSREEEITLFGTIKMILPAVIVFALLWLLIIICWYIVGLPIGIGTFPTI